MPVMGVPLLECICWDHDRFGKDYMGEFDIALEDIFQDGQISQQVRVAINPIAHLCTRKNKANSSSSFSAAQMVQSQIQTSFQPLHPKEEEEGQHSLR